MRNLILLVCLITAQACGKSACETYKNSNPSLTTWVFETPSGGKLYSTNYTECGTPIPSKYNWIFGYEACPCNCVEPLDNKTYAKIPPSCVLVGKK